METIRFRNDTITRKRLMVPESFAHPAKGQLGMWALMIEKYSKPGDTVLDCMAGSGATLLAALMGRNVVCVEMEPHFVDPMRRSWEKMRTMPMLGYTMGQAVILRGDARNLPLLSADCVITSPPFGEALSGGGIAIKGYGDNDPGMVQRVYSKRAMSADCVITSPPYQGAWGADDSTYEATQERERRHRERHPEYPRPPIPGAYTRPVDAIVTSPSYEKQDAAAHKGQLDGMVLGPAVRSNGGHDATGNVGNLRGDAYWQSMAQIYRECWRVLKPGGIMALVLKGFTRDGKYVDLPSQTEAMLLEAGWVKHDHWKRELYSLSFWRILQRRKDPAAFDNRLWFEEVLAFRKPEGQGRGVDTVITSPPYQVDKPGLPSGTGAGAVVGVHGTGYTRPVSVIITSPPYEGSVSDNKEGPSQTSVPGGWKADTVNKHGGYTRPPR